jgi:hypothetical protein
MTSLNGLMQLMMNVPVVRTLWRVGYGKRTALAGFGWRPVFWRLWWLDVRAERECLERYAANWNVRVIEGESNKSLHERIRYVIRSGWR